MINDNDGPKRRTDTYTVSSGKSNNATVSTKTASALNSTQKDDSNARVVAAAAHAVVPNLANLVLMVFLILGGCCTNVFALEAIIKEQPTAGPLITFAQFALCALFTLPHFISPSTGLSALFIKPRAIPLRSWVIYTAYFVSVNLLNNWAFAYKISVPLHIILRSGGPVASMMVGYIYNGRRYSRGQIISIAMLTVGVMAAALADAQAKGQSLEIGLDGEGDGEAMKNTVIGFSILALAMLLSAFQGIYADRLYAFYGRDHWKEALFYSHMLSLPIFFSSWSTLYSQWRIVASSPSLLSHLDMEKTSPLSGGNIFGSILELVHASPQVQSILDHIPIQVSYLLMNALTQYLCIRGVHLLSAKSSSLTVTVALNIRKLVSLLLSIYLFGNQLGSGVLLGAVLVFVGGGLYGIEGARLRNASKGKGEKTQ
ncbi:hypothetical protein N7533_011551 [Penicillium manginii]|uniref:uncharacterized protein n=1 Tax=Penicillium manginii TaxID=203109 RepID=UPI0025494BC9|nr:uncharacterized protein N7533_011551 [Penicillium manginii]KAJ5742142.1 hypothetical protein N7533_011551 [Penicillium manginii]